ncbi:hypothetical protein HW532_16550 [Kaustia mangrovi]|uniref:Uncharacterized protein n=1 Tax=Kaustia mangrovi TaxID=2593653 RepID=A0A7S8C686_9HYPH|nr:hypothetical protein [Kaustia mangrovi]QPC44163.1 hypothetical protein HW532_16550 [Kaustia mangrovi]
MAGILLGRIGSRKSASLSPCAPGPKHPFTILSPAFRQMGRIAGRMGMSTV